MRMGLQQEILALDEGEAAIPRRQRTALAILFEGLGDGLAVHDDDSGPIHLGAANLIAADCRDLFHEWDIGCKNSARDDHHFDEWRRLNESGLPSLRKPVFDAVEAERRAAGGIV